MDSSCQCSPQETWGKPHLMAKVTGSPRNSSLSMLGRAEPLKCGGVYESISVSNVVMAEAQISRLFLLGRT